MSQLNSLGFHDITSLRRVESPHVQALCALRVTAQLSAPGGTLLCQAFLSHPAHVSKAVFRQRQESLAATRSSLPQCPPLSRTLPLIPVIGAQMPCSVFST